MLAFGWAGDEALPTIWTSVDGVTWSSTAALADMDPVTAVAESPGGLAAFGTRYSDEIDDLAADRRVLVGWHCFRNGRGA